jgi:hypothetical protein
MDPQKETADLGQLWASTVDTVTSNDTIDLSSLNLTSSITAGAYGAVGTNAYPYTISTGISQPWGATHVSAKIKLDGEGADVEVNGWSLVNAVKRIEERLGLYQPNPEMEKEWEELHALAEQYRKLEQHIKDKQATFDRLRAMPAPDIE